MEKLKSSFKRRGVFYNEVAREDYKVMYSLSYDEKSVIGYDVCRICVGEPNAFLNKDDVFEFLPSSEQWGSKAWSFCSRDKALVFYNSLKRIEKS